MPSFSNIFKKNLTFKILIKMSKSQNFVFIILFYFIHIKFSLQDGITNDQDCRDDNKKYSSLTLSCIDKSSIPINPDCDPNTQEQREDGGCINIIDCDDDYKPMRKNYFGIFFDTMECSKNSLLNPFKIYDNAPFDNCENENLIGCQVLINLCTLYYRSKENEPICKKLESTNTKDKVIYQDYNFLNDESYLSNIRYSLDPDQSARTVSNIELNFWVMKYFLNGTLLSFEPLEYDFIQCSNSKDNNTNYKTFAFNVIYNCFLDIKENLDIRKNFFYEIFIENFLSTNTNPEQQSYVQVPIKIINENSDEEVYVKRMFLHVYEDIPNISENEKIYFYAKKVKLCINISSNDKEKIKLPIFEVTYDKKKISEIKDDSIQYEFITEYKGDISSFIKAMVTIFIILTVIVGLLVIYRVYVWIKMNPSNMVKSSYFLLIIFEFFYKSVKFLGIFYFWFTFGISAYWYFFFKLQYRNFAIMPPLDDDCYTKFKIIFYIGFVCYMIYMLIRVYKQVSFDIFFIDWEKDQDVENIGALKSSIDVKYRKHRSAWRMIHVVNQFNELQKKRIFHLYFGFCWIILLYYRCNWYRREQQIPADKKVDEAPVNFVLRNFIASIIVLASCSIELVLARLLKIWIPLKKQEFMDLCSVSNISVFILDELLHGYYIHGKSPNGKADVNYDELFNFLSIEGAGTMASRGLENDNNTDHEQNQTYEMFLSNSMRIVYDGLYIIQTESMLVKSTNIRNYFKKSRIGMKLFKNFLNYEKDRTMLDNYMNNQLKAKIDILVISPKDFIRDKSFIQKILGYTMDSSELERTTKDIILYRDYSQNFDDVLFYGMEWEWFVMDLFLFQFLMIISDDNFLSMFITYIFDYLLYYIRIFFGNRNVAKKAVIDDRFIT